MNRSQVRRVAVVAVVVAVALATLVPAVSAHAHLTESNPDNGEQLDELPAELTLTYSGDGIQIADVTVIGPDDEDVSGEAEIDPYNSQLVTAPLEDAGDGMYLVEWEVLADDGHTTSGTFFFSVGDEQLDRDTVVATHESGTDDDVAWLEAGGKALVLAALAGLIGVPVTAMLAVSPVLSRYTSGAGKRGTGVDGGGSKQTQEGHEATETATLQSGIDQSIRLLCLGLALVLVVGVFVFGVARIQSLGPLSIDTAADFVGTPVGTVWSVQAGVALALATFVLAGSRVGLSRRLFLGGTGAGALVVAAGVAWTSHSATAIDRLWGFTVDFLHIVAAGVWVGGLVVLAVVLPRLHSASDDSDSDLLVGGIARRYSVLALGGATFAVGTGLTLASWHVSAGEELTGTFYGTVLLVKLALIALALALGGYHRFILLPKLEPQSSTVLGRLLGRNAIRSDGGRVNLASRLTTTVRLEVVVLVCVLLLSGVLTSAATAAVVGVDDGVESDSLEATVDDGVTVELTALPTVSAPTEDRIAVQQDEVVVFDVVFERDGERVTSDRPVELLAITRDGETTVEQELEDTGDGTYTVVQTLPEFGLWEVRVTGTPDGSFESVWFDVHSMPVVHEDGHDHDDGHDHGSHDHDDGHDHGAHDHGTDDTSPLGEPLRLGGLLIVLYGVLGVAYEANALSRREKR